MEEIIKPHLAECNQVVAKWDNVKNKYPKRFYHYEEGSIQVDEQLARLRAVGLNIIGWTIPEGKELLLLNLGTKEEPKNVKINAKLDYLVIREAKRLFKEYKDIFAWSYHDLLGIPESIYQHRIELETGAIPVHQRRYCMNPNYASVVKKDINKLLDAGFIVPVETTTWLSPIVVVPKKNGKL